MILTDMQKNTIKAIVGVFETGRAPSIASYGVVTNIKGDTGGLTYGKHQTTINSGNLYLLIKAYCEDTGADYGQAFQQYLDRLFLKDADLAKNQEFLALLRKSADDPDMREAQDAFFERVYWQPAYETAVRMGLQRAVSFAIVYDSFIHGSWARIKRMVDTEIGSVEMVGEIRWIKEYNKMRREWLANHSNKVLNNTVYRQDAFNVILRSDNWDLRLPLVVRNVELTAANVSMNTHSSAPIMADNRVSAVENEDVARLLVLTAAPYMSGDDVKNLQIMLDKYGLPVTIDGVYGPATAEAVRIFQRRNDLRVDGIAGPVTFKKLELLT